MIYYKVKFKYDFTEELDKGTQKKSVGRYQYRYSF